MSALPCPSLAEALIQARTLGVERLDAQLLLAHVLRCSRGWLIAHDDAVLAPEQAEAWAQMVQQRAEGVPLAYLTGRHEFHGLDLDVTSAVLDPRPDTETLVDWALELLASHPHPTPQVVDLGTGSGAIALALRCRSAAHTAVWAVDVSPAALDVARSNGERLGLPVHWLQGSWFEPLIDQRFDMIVSNPPYIAEGDPHLPALRHEPLLALTSGADGLDAIRHIVEQAPDHLLPAGWLLLEHGHDQGPAVAGLLQTRGFRHITHRHDLAGHCRCTGACFAV